MSHLKDTAVDALSVSLKRMMWPLGLPEPFLPSLSAYARGLAASVLTGVRLALLLLVSVM